MEAKVSWDTWMVVWVLALASAVALLVLWHTNELKTPEMVRDLVLIAG